MLAKAGVCNDVFMRNASFQIKVLGINLFAVKHGNIERHPQWRVFIDGTLVIAKYHEVVIARENIPFL